MSEALNKYDLSLKENRDEDDFEYPVSFYQTNLIELPLGYVHWHWHEEVELVYLVEGQCEFHIAEEVFTSSAPFAAFVNSNVLHSYHPVQGEPNFVYSIVFHPSFLFGHGQTYFGSRYLTPILASESMKYLHVNPDSDFFAAICSLIQISQKKEFGYELLAKSCLCKIWFYVLSELPATQSHIALDPMITQDETRVKMAIQFIEIHHADSISLDDIAGSIHISRSECCRCFKRALKVTPFEYLMKYRIFESTRILQANPISNISISELASMVGFNNTSYYNKLFKKYIHITPSQYKRQLIATRTISSPSDR